MPRIRYPKLGDPKNKEIEDAYFKRLRESEGFDLAGVTIPLGATEVVHDYNPYQANVLVKLYARVGLHRYNMLMGGNLELMDLKIYYKRRSVPSIFYITVDALDTVSGVNKVFQVKVSERHFRFLDIKCTIARPQVTHKLSDNNHPVLEIGDHSSPSSVDDFYKDSLPKWPPSDDAFSDTNRFYVVKESELQDHRWIQLYLEVVVATKLRIVVGTLLQLDDLSHLNIVKVVIETKDALHLPSERINAKWAIFYIRFKNKGSNCIAIVRRLFDETTGDLMLQGDTWSVQNAFNTNEQHNGLESGHKEEFNKNT